MEDSCLLFASNKIGARLAAADQPHTVSIHENFRGARARIVIGRLDRAVCASAPQDEHILRTNFSERPILQETITRFTNWADDVGTVERPGRPPGARDGVRRII
jgi:hypothetical protein